MEYLILYVFVEGEDDERFFNKIIKPRLLNMGNYDYVKVMTYANEEPEWLFDFINSIKKMNANYIYTRDFNKAPCITYGKQSIQKKLTNVDKNKIIVVVKEIESWYLAGLSDKYSKKLKISLFRNTNDITKEEFNNLIPKKFERRDFMVETLKFFNIEIAMRKNGSFKYFIDKYNL